MKRMRKTIAWCLIAGLALASGGCVSVRKKFVRKPKAGQAELGPELFLELKDTATRLPRKCCARISRMPKRGCANSPSW